MRKGRRLITYKTSILVFLSIWVMATSCSKTTDTSFPTPPPPVISGPTGEIQTFLISDSLVAFNAGSTIKWLVNGTNSLTVVTLNGVKIGLYGVLDTGPLKQNTTYTLSVNSGKMASITLHISDSITTALWAQGKRLKQVKKEVFILPQGATTDSVWVDTAMSVRVIDQRLYFDLDRSVKIIQISPNQVAVNDAGRIMINATQDGFTWQGVLYTIVTLNSNNLVLTFLDTSNGIPIKTRNTYNYE